MEIAIVAVLSFAAGVLGTLFVVTLYRKPSSSPPQEIGGAVEVEVEKLREVLEKAVEPKKKRNRTMWGDV